MRSRLAARPGFYRLRPGDLEALYEHKLRPTDGSRPLSPKSVCEIHLIIRAVLNDAHRHGLVTRSVALVANAPKLRELPPVEPHPWTADELQAFLHTAAVHRLFPAFWLAAHTGVRRSELLGLQWRDIDFEKNTLSINRGILRSATRSASPAARHRARAARSTSDRPRSRFCAGGKPGGTPPRTPLARTRRSGCSPAPTASRSTHARFSQAFERVARRAGIPAIRLHDLRHTHATLLLKEHVTPKVVTERLGHARVAFTLETYQHVHPGTHADAARTFEALVTPCPAAITAPAGMSSPGR